MSATNKTTNYDLPIFVGTDKPSWLGDWNSAMTAIDTAIARAKSTGDSATTVAGQAKSTAEAASETATAASETAAAASTAASNATTIANNANTQAGDAKTDAHAALEVATELNELFSGNMSTSILNLYTDLIPSTDYTGYIALLRSNYMLKVTGYMIITASGIKKITSMKTADGTSRLYLLGVMPGNPFDIYSSTNPQQGVYLGAYWVKPTRTDSTLEPITHATLYMVYNPSTQRTEVWGGLAFVDVETGNLKSNYSTVEIIPALFYFKTGIRLDPSLTS